MSLSNMSLSNAVLFEVGYINNPDDAGRRLASAQGRGLFASTTARAIRVFFARQSVR